MQILKTFYQTHKKIIIQAIETKKQHKKKPNHNIIIEWYNTTATNIYHHNEKMPWNMDRSLNQWHPASPLEYETVGCVSWTRGIEMQID